MTKNNYRLEYIDGLKGILCMIVALNHFQNLYKLPFKSTFMYKTLFNGTYAVVIFLLISNFFMAKHASSISTCESLKNSILKRYFKMSFPIFIVSSFILVVYSLGGFNDFQAAMEITGGYDPALHFKGIEFSNLFLNSFFRCLFKRSSDFTFVLWMVVYLFLGNLMTILISIIAKKTNFFLTTSLCAFFTTVIIYNYFHTLLLTAPFGFYLYYIMSKFKIEKPQSIILLLLSFYLVYINNLNGVLETFFKHWNYYNSNILLIVSGFLFLLGLSNISILKNFFGIRIFKMLGAISFPVFLIHQPLTTSVCTSIYIKLFNNMPTLYPKFILLIIYIIFTIFLSFCFYHFIEKRCNIIAEKIVSNFF